MSCMGSLIPIYIFFSVQSLSIKPKLATATGLASHQGNVGKQQRTGQATSNKQQSVSSTAGTAASTTPITVGGRTVNVFVSTLCSCLSRTTPFDIHQAPPHHFWLTSCILSLMQAGLAACGHSWLCTMAMCT